MALWGNPALTAAHARPAAATVVTANVAEFSRILGLNVENWLDHPPTSNP
jgi:tRNA(fMet)-specific endonuclease VapC